MLKPMFENNEEGLNAEIENQIAQIDHAENADASESQEGAKKRHDVFIKQEKTDKAYWYVVHT